MYRVWATVSCHRRADRIPRATLLQVKAIEISHLRAAKSLGVAGLDEPRAFRQQKNRSRDAQRLLGDIYAWFPEGLDSADLKEGASLLEEPENSWIVWMTKQPPSIPSPG